MPKKATPRVPEEMPSPRRLRQMPSTDDPENPDSPVEDPDTIPDDDPEENPPDEIPPTGKRS